jgi:hypothetical protein
MEGIGVLIAVGPAVVMLVAGILIARILERTILCRRAALLAVEPFP